MTDLSVEDYSERAIVVRGDTKPFKEDLKLLGGKFNGSLKGGPGWIFPKKIEDDVLTFISTGKIYPKKGKEDLFAVPVTDKDLKSKFNESGVEVFNYLKTQLPTLTLEQRLELIALLSNKSSLKTATNPIVTNPIVTKPIVTKPATKSKIPVKVKSIDEEKEDVSEEEEEDEEEEDEDGEQAPRKRLLR